MNSRKNVYFGYRSFWPEPEAHRRFDNIGVETVCFFAANTINSLGEPYCAYPPSWVFKDYSVEGQYDFDPVDAQMADLMRDSPHAAFICMVDLNTPRWMSPYILRCDSFSQLGRVCADPEWRRATALYLRRFLEHMESRHAERIVAYVLACGNTCEWYDLSGLAESPSRAAAWTRERAEKGLPAADIPGLNVRNHISFDGLLRDPAVDGEALAYLRFCERQIVETTIFFLQEARKTIRQEIELGVFFGYPLCLEGERVIMGNNDCAPLIRRPELDFIISPSYGLYFSGMGGGGGDLGPTESVQLHGKRYLRECDQKTHTYNRRISKHVIGNWEAWATEAETLAGLKREAAYTIVKQCSCWWFDMWGGFYDSPAVMKLLEQALSVYQRWITEAAEPVAEIALVVDPESIPYLNQNDPRVAWFYRGTKHLLDQIGAPWECYYFNDIPAVNRPNRIKLWLLPGIFELTPEKRHILDEFVRLPGQTALYLYAPGISDGVSLDPDRVRQLTGTSFGTRGVTTVEMSGHRSVYAASGPDLTLEALAGVARSAGIHFYTDPGEPVYANSRLLGIHTATGGVRTIRLPRRSAAVHELFTNQTIAQNCDRFEYKLRTPDTALFSW